MLIKIILSLAVFLLVIVLLFIFGFFNGKNNEAISFKKSAFERKKNRLGIEEDLTKIEKIEIFINELLRKSEKDRKYFYKLVFKFFIIGFLTGQIVFSGMFLSTCIGISFIPISVLYLMIKTQEITRRELSELENAMNMITNAYLSSNNILKSFEEYINEIDKSVPKELRSVTPFHEFVTEVIYYNPNLDTALQKLKIKINNFYFKDWIDKLRLCNLDSNMKFSLKTTIDAMNDEKVMQMESDFQMKKTWITYFSTVGITFSVILVFKFSNKEWYYYLVHTFGGKLIIFLMILAALISSIYVAKINKPISQI